MNQPTAQVIDGSVRFDGNNQYLTRSFGSGNRKKWTWACWAKRYKHGASNYGLFSYYPGSGNGGFLRFSDDDGGDTFRFYDTGNSLSIVSKEKFRDTGWYHIVIAVDTTQATNSDRVKRYVNGVRQLVNASNTWPDLNDDLDINQSGNHFIGRVQASAYGHVSLSNNYFIDGQQLGPGYFGFIDPLTNTWRPRKFRAVGTTINDGTVWSSLASVSSGSFQGSYPATNGFNGTLTSSDRANGDTNGSSIDLDFSGKNIIVKNDIAIWSGKSSMRYSINGGEYISYSDATEKWKTILFSGRLLSLKIKHGSNSEQPGFSGLAVDGVTMLDSTTTNLAFGTNGYYLPMDNQDDFEKDKSGKGNDWTKSGFSGTSINPDIVKDSPSGAVFGGRAQTGITTTSSAPANYCTLNPIDKESNVVLSNGNLDGTASGGDGNYRGTMRMISGKFYWEVTQIGGGNYSTYGIIRDGQLPISELNSDTITYRNDGLTKKNGVDGSTYNSISGDEVLGIACDCDKNEISYYKNNTLQGTLTFTTNMAVEGVYAYGRWNNGKSADYNFGQKPFKYAPPQGFLPVNSATTRPNTVISRPDQYVGITTWKGDGNTGRQIRTLSFSPDLVWIKQSSTSRAHAWFDTVRGANKRLQSSTTNGETTHTDQMSAFLSNGFTVEDNNTVNVSDGIYRGFCWKAGGSKNTFNIDDVGYSSAAAAGLDGGSINPTGASIGTKQGFSIIGYTGTDNASDTFAHGLSQKPDFALFKNRSQDGDDWISYNSTPSLGATKRVKFNTADGSDSQTSQFNDTEPTSSLFTIGTYDNINKLNNNYIAYIWHNVPGLQKFGEFLGDGGSGDDGPFVETGFRPALIWLRPFAGSGIANNGGWYIWDVQNDSNPYNDDSAVNKPGNYFNYGNLNNGMASHAMAGIDILSNGFKLRRDTAGYSNYSGWTYIYCAFADTPASNLFGGQSNAR